MRNVLRWVFWSPRNAALAATGLVVVLVVAAAVLRLSGAGPTSPAPVVDTSTCAGAATGFTNTFLDRSRADRAWRGALAPLVTADAAQQLPDLPRGNLPGGRTARVEAVAQPGSCDAIAVLDTGTRVSLELVEESGRWRVSGWGDGP